MKKSILLVVVAVMSAVGANAQEKKEYGKFDFEIGITAPVAASSIAGKTNAPIPFFYLEGRWQLKQQPIDIGFYTGISVVQRKYSGSYDNYRMTPVLAVADWQFGRGKKVNPYVGLGMGVSETLIVAGMGKGTWKFAAAPRVGVRLFKTANISAGWLMTTRKDFSRVYANVGFYF